MAQYVVCTGGVYGTEDVPGTVSDPTTVPTPSSILEPLYLSIGQNGAISELRCGSYLHAEGFDAAITQGQWIQLSTGYGSGSGVGSGGPRVVFDGIVVNEHIVIGGESENTELVAYDHGSYLLHRIALHGQYRRSYTKEQAYFTNGATGGTIPLTLQQPDMVLIDTPLVFNPDGQPNRTADIYVTSGNSMKSPQPTFYLFEVPFRDQYNSTGKELQAEYWTIKDAVEYLLNVTNASWCIDPVSWADSVLTTELSGGNPVISNINCEGKSLGQALTEILSPHNYSYWVDPGLNTNNLHNINFYCKGKGPAKTLNLSARGTAASANSSNLVQADLLMDNAGTVNRVEAFGDRLTFTTLAHTNPPSGASPPLPLLQKCWHDADLVYPQIGSGETQPNWWDTAFRTKYCNSHLLTSPSGGAGSGGALFGVGRCWVVNLGETPWYPLENLSLDLVPSGSGSGSSDGGTAGSGSGGGSGSGSSPIDTSVHGYNSVDPRRFEKPELYTVNSEGGLLSQQEVIVEISTTNGQTWEIVERSEYRILPDSLGIVFTNPSLDLLGIDLTAIDGSGSDGIGGGSGGGSGSTFGKGYWQALYDGMLQIRIVASIKSDERVHARVNNDGTAFPLAVGAVFNNSGYKRVLYNEAINNALYYVNYPPSRVAQDDTQALLTLTQSQLANSNRTQVSGSARVLVRAYGDYNVGDSITQITNRNIDISAGNGGYPSIVHLVYKFQEQQCELTLDNHRVATIIRAKPINEAANRNQHKLGIEHPVANPGGHNVPYLPETSSQGTNESWQKYMENGGGQ